MVGLVERTLGSEGPSSSEEEEEAETESSSGLEGGG